MALALSQLSVAAASALSVVNDTPDFQNYFLTDEPITFTFRINGGRPPADADIDYTITDYRGEVVIRNSSRLARGWGFRLGLREERGQLGSGWFQLKVKLSRGKDLQLSDPTTVDFCVLPPVEPMDPRDSWFGIGGSFGGHINPGPWINAVTIVPIERSGARWIRINSGWAALQKSAEAPVHWAFYDEAVSETAARGIKILPLMVTSPEFAIDPDLETPMNPYKGQPMRRILMPPMEAPWRKFLSEAVRRYHDQVPYWEIWNEPNAAGMWPYGDPDSFAQFFNLSGEIVKSTAPSARVVMGGTSGIKAGWLQSFFRHGANPDYLDVIAVHPYRGPESIPERGDPEASPGYGRKSLLQALAEVRQVMAELPPLPDGRKRELWCTESGFNTSDRVHSQLLTKVSKRKQARMVVRTMALARLAGVDRFFWFRFFSTYGSGTGIVGSHENRFAPKPAYVAYAIMERKLGQTNKTSRLPVGSDDVFLVCFEGASTPVYVAWALKETAARLTVDRDGKLLITDMMGGSEERLVEKGRFSLTIGPDPIYLQPASSLKLSVSPGE